jgi:hypothetical protein
MWNAGGRTQAVVFDPGRSERDETQRAEENGLGGATDARWRADTCTVAFCQLSIIVFPDSPKAWTARCLEHDLSACGATAEAAIDTLIKIADAHIAFDMRHGRPPLSAFTAAPRPYWNAFSRAHKSRPVELHRPDGDRALFCAIAMIDQHPIIASYQRPSRIA